MQAICIKASKAIEGVYEQEKASWNGGAIRLERQLWARDGAQRQNRQHTPARAH